MSKKENLFTKKLRQRWISVLAKASVGELTDAWDTITNKPDYRFLRQPETGMIMVRAKTGGSGQAFNLGEMTVTRCTVKTGSGFVGCGYVMGRDHQHAAYAALFDAILQDENHRPYVLETIISQFERTQQRQKDIDSKKSAASKVDFFTMVRGD